MNVEGILRGTPILTAGLLFSMLVFLLLKRRVSTWTEIFFELSILCLGLFALDDFLCYNSEDPRLVLFAARLGLSELNLAVLFLVFFTISFRRSPNRRWLVLLPMSVIVLMVTWMPGMSDVVRTPWGWGVVSQPESLAVFDAYVCFYFMAGCVHTYAASKRIGLNDKSLARKTLWLTLSLAIYVGMAFAADIFVGDARASPFPVFSIALVLPVSAMMPLTFPETWERWVKALKSYEGRRYEVMAVNLMREDGTLIGSKSLFSTKSFDIEKLSRTLAVIQSYVKTSFPASSGDSLRTIDHGDTRILIEKGNFTFIALVLKGKENEFLRRQMRDALASFESWSGQGTTGGVSADGNKKGAIKALDMFFAKESLF
jgi:hypothetical protein